MAEKINEQLSALVDGEYEQAELELLYRRMSKDSGLKDRWERYHFISDTVRQHLPETVTLDFSQRVMAAIDDADSATPQTADEVVEARGRSSLLKPLIGFALAASVAMVAVMNVDLTPDIHGDSGMQTTATTAGPDNSPGTPRFDSPEVDQRLNTYLVNHSEYVSMNGVNGVIPYVRLVGYQAGY